MYLFIYLFICLFIYLLLYQGLKKPQSRVGNLCTHTCDKENCLQENQRKTRRKILIIGIWPEDLIWEIKKVTFISILWEHWKIWGHLCIPEWDLHLENISYLVNNTKSGKIIFEGVHAFRIQAVWFFSSKLFAVLFLHNTLIRNRATHEPNRRYSKMQFWTEASSEVCNDIYVLGEYCL